MLILPNLETWVNVPTNSILTIHKQTVMVHPIIDQYYDRSPYHVRSSAFVQAKGLVTNEKAPPPQLDGAVVTPGAYQNPPKSPFDSPVSYAPPHCNPSMDPSLPRRPMVPTGLREPPLTATKAKEAPSLTTPSVKGNQKKKRLSVNGISAECPKLADHEATNKTRQHISLLGPS
jgi:glutamine amidotransferase